MARIDDEIALFLGALEETPDLWQSIDIRTLAVQVEGSWYNLLSRFRLDARPAREVPRLEALPRTDVIGCWQEVRSVDTLEPLLKEIRQGLTEIDGSPIHFRMPQQPELGAPLYYDSGYARLSTRLSNASKVVQPGEYVAHQLTINPTTTSALIGFVAGGHRVVEYTLYGLDRPWDGLAGLARVALQSGVHPTNGHTPQLEVVAPLGAAFDKTDAELAHGVLRCALWTVSGTTAARTSVGYIAEYEDGTFRNGTAAIPARRWRGRGERRAVVNLQFGRGVRRVTLLLRIGPHLIETFELLDLVRSTENPHLAAYRVMDPDLERLRKALETTEAIAHKKPEAARQFERAVAQLFALGGFHAEALGGYPGVQQTVDVLVRSPDGSVLLPMECTVGALSSTVGKPGRLASRTEDLRRIPELAGAELLPIMVTSRPRAAVLEGDFQYVGKSGIGVLCQEDLQAILGEIERGASASDVVLYCRRCIPRGDEPDHVLRVVRRQRG